MFKQPVCWNCKHFIAENYTCIAFSDGIPTEITENMNEHLVPLPDQENDIVFEPIED
jgi:hypothetical protein